MPLPNQAFERQEKRKAKQFVGPLQQPQGAGRLADSDAAAAVSGEGGCRRGVRPVVGLLSGLKGRPDLLEPDLRCDVLHLTDEPG